MKAQVAFEYILILGFAFAIVIPGAYLFYRHSISASDELVSSRIHKIGTDLVTTSQEAYGHGLHSWLTYSTNLPDETINIYVLDDFELIIEYNTRQGVSQAIYFSNVNLSGADCTTTPNVCYLSNNFHTGLNKYRIESKGDYVSITETV